MRKTAHYSWWYLHAGSFVSVIDYDPADEGPEVLLLWRKTLSESVQCDLIRIIYEACA
jgi:hypothetical protein